MPKANAQTLQIIHQDAHLIAIHKPHGIAFHTDDHQQGIVALLRDQLNDDSLFPVHRLDKETSGLMLFARHEEANASLSQLFQNRQVEKYYLALVANRPKKKQGSVIGDMAKARNGNYKLLRTTQSAAITRLRAFTIKSPSESNEGLASCLLFKPETGKTHQLRVAAKSLSCPIIGDRRYGGATSDRMYLHSWCKRFVLFDTTYHIVSRAYDGALFTDNIKAQITAVEQTLTELSWPKSSFLIRKI